MNRLYILLLFFGFNVFSQQLSKIEEFRTTFPNFHSVRLNQETLVNISVKAGEVEITQAFFEEDLYLSEAATLSSKRSINYSNFFEIGNIEASSFSFENGKYKETKINTYKEKDELDHSFHDDAKSINFIFPNLDKGSKSRLQYVEKIKNPRFLSAFYFGDYFPILNNKVTFVVDKNVELYFKEFHTDSLSINFEKEVKRKSIVYTWELENISGYEYEADAPSYRKIFPHIIPIIKSYTIDGVKTNLLGETSDLYTWYYSLVENINSAPISDELQEIVQELVSDKDDDLAKVKAIFYWVQQNIKYVAFEYALGGFIPRNANDVYNKKYGDCKDNSSIMSEMLKIAGIEGHLTWIGTRDIPYKYNEVPTPAVDNHMILTYINDDEIYFLDATSRYVPFGFPTSFIQGKEALVENGAGSYHIYKVPVIPSFDNSFKETTEISIDGDKIVGNSEILVDGYEKIDYYRGLENKNTDEKLKQFYNNQLKKGNNSFLIGNLVETNKFDIDNSFKINYEFKIKNYVKALNDEIYINLNLNKTLVDYQINDERKYDLEYDHKRSFHYQTRLKIPAGYEVAYIPDNISFSNDLMSVKINYELLDQDVIYKHYISQDFLSLDLLQQKELKSLIKKVEKNYNEIIILKKI